jgi:DNA-nicking Smr family endonuclease
VSEHGGRPADGTGQASDDPVAIPIEDALDLHAFAPRDVPSVVAEYLGEAHARGFREVRLIHGRGIGVQRRVVQSVLAKHPLVARYEDAPPDRGGHGATLVWLRRGADA